MSVDKLFNSYIQAGIFFKGWSPKTAVVYRRAWASFQQSQRELETGMPTGWQMPLTKAQLEAWIIWMRQKGMSPAGCNIYIRAMNAFGTWLKEEGHIEAASRLKQIRVPHTQLVVFSSVQVKTILAYRPKRFSEIRIWTLMALLIDTGLRVDEALGITPNRMDLENLLVTVRGKGNKERKVPVSIGLRKVLFRYLQLKEKRGERTEYLFCTRSELALRYRERVSRH